MKQEFWFDSKSGCDRLHGVRWVPEGEIKAVMQVVHGMAEHIERYDGFGRYLAERGVLVVGHSHLGHGKSVKRAEDLGYFAEPDGNACVVADIHGLRQRTQSAYPDVPYFMLGHSMGSFLTRQYLGLHAEGLSGAVIMGTADMPGAVLAAGKAVCTAIARVKGWRHRSQLVNSMAVGGYEKKLGPHWLSKNEENVAKYAADPLCGFCFTLNGFYGLFSAIDRANRREQAGNIPKDIPILFNVGTEDPVGNNAKGVRSLYERYLKHGAKATIRLYEGDRHEILNENDRFTVYEDIYRWMEV